MEHATLREANSARQREWLGSKTLPLTFRTNELAGEYGEVADLLLDKWGRGTRFNEAWTEMLAEEISDTVICADLIAWHFGTAVDVIAAEAYATSLGGSEYRWCAQVMRDLGLLCNYAKKLDRAGYGIAGGITPSGETQQEVLKLVEPLVRLSYNLAHDMQIIMPLALARKFNKTSRKVGLQTFLVPPGIDRALLIPEASN